MLIDYYGTEICFSYPKDAKKSQMFFSTRVKFEDTRETLRRNDFIQECGEYLREECQNLDLGLTGSYSSADDIGGDYMIPFCRDEILSRFAGIPAV